MKAKNVLFSVVSAVIVGWFSSTYAVNIDSQIDDALNQKAQEEMQKKVQDLNEKITFTKVNSCESMEKVMSGFLETYRKLHPQRTYNRWFYYEDDLDYAVVEIHLIVILSFSHIFILCFLSWSFDRLSEIKISPFFAHLPVKPSPIM